MTEQQAFLYVEDHPASRQVFRLIMTSILGFDDLTLLDTTADIINKLVSIDKQFDVIFLDINIQPIDGYAVCKLLREHPDYADTRIVGLTANVTPAIIRKMQEYGFNGIIGKPISHETFAEQLTHILQDKPLWEA